ncbi:hypothetical protein VTO73DRAFT_10014 [Trametes versicolor]
MSSDGDIHRSRVYVELTAPAPSSSAERRAWDMRFRGEFLGLVPHNPAASISPEGSREGADVSDVRSHRVEDMQDDTLSDSPASVASTLVDSMADLNLAKTIDDAPPHTPAPSIIRSDTDSSSGLESLGLGEPGDDDFRGTFLMPTRDFGYSSTTANTDPQIESKCQLYLMTVSFLQEVPEDLKKKLGSNPINSSFRLMVDTGSTMAWIIGHGCREAVVENGSEVARRWSHRIKRQGRRMTVYKHGVSKVNGEWVIDPNAVPGRVAYADGNVALLTLMEKEQEVTIGSCYDWGTVRYTSAFRMQFKFGVAYAMSPSLYQTTYDGSVGFNLRSFALRAQPHFQGASESERTPPSFTAAIIDQNLLLPPESGASNRGIIYYFALRLSRSQESFFGWNHWPCADLNDPERSAGVPDWSDIIPVVSKTQWVVEMISMLFERYVLDETTNTHSWVVVDNSLFMFGQNGRDSIRVVLDTGTSSTWAPPPLIRHFRRNVFGVANVGSTIGTLNLQLDNAQGDTPVLGEVAPSISDTPPPYVCPDPSDLPLWRIKLQFKGEYGRTVDVYAPAFPFLCATNASNRASEGLIFASRPDFYILGLNFFQSMFVSMHNVSSDRPGRAYVKMAPQWQDEIDNFKLPVEKK